jgi:hypothetical protein
VTRPGMSSLVATHTDASSSHRASATSAICLSPAFREDMTRGSREQSAPIKKNGVGVNTISKPDAVA